MISSRPVIVVFRQDLRVNNHPALYNAAMTGAPLLPVYIYDETTPGPWKIGGSAKVWLHYSLLKLQKNLEKLGAPLFIAKGSFDTALKDILKKSNAREVFWNRCYEPYWKDAENTVVKTLDALKIPLHTYNGSLLVEPWELKPKTGPFYKVYSHFHKAFLKAFNESAPLPAPKPFAGYKLQGLKVEALELLPHHPDWAQGIYQTWHLDRDESKKRLHAFTQHISLYPRGRDFPSESATSRLSPYLHFGEISPLEIFYELNTIENTPLLKNARLHYMKELVWREFAYHILHHFPELPSIPYQKKFKAMTWSHNKQHLEAWQKGITGYPLVDAGMRELWQTGYMHNRVRMIAASFLIKDLLIPWQEGEKWFWDTLVDADLANNAFNWQWVAGCGFDAAPYFRIFNPTLQGKRFDPEGAYVKKWVPELKEIPARYIHAPWEAPDQVLESAGVRLGKEYPLPIIDHAEARKKALVLYKAL